MLTYLSESNLIFVLWFVYWSNLNSFYLNLIVLVTILKSLHLHPYRYMCLRVSESLTKFKLAVTSHVTQTKYSNNVFSTVFPLVESHDIIARSERPKASTSLVTSRPWLRPYHPKLKKVCSAQPKGEIWTLQLFYTTNHPPITTTNC